jgi:hypothetical protein
MVAWSKPVRMVVEYLPFVFRIIRLVYGLVISFVRFDQNHLTMPLFF